MQNLKWLYNCNTYDVDLTLDSHIKNRYKQKTIIFTVIFDIITAKK